MLASALPQMPDLRMLLLRNNGLKEQDLKVLAAALLNPACSGVCGLDLGFNQLGPESSLLLLPLLHQPPQMLLQARRRSTAEAAAEYGGLERSHSPSSSGVVGGTAVCVGSGADRSSDSRNGSVTAQQATSVLRLQRRVSTQQPISGAGHAMLLQLVLCNNQIGDAGAQVVCRLVGTGDCLLQLLDLSGCGITEGLSGCLKGMLEGARCVCHAGGHGMCAKRHIHD